MDPAKLRAWWWQRQGFDGALVGKSAAEILARTGWARSVGGVGPYLTLWSRGRIGREAADRAVAEGEIQELPSARGCTYVVPASDVALALRIGQAFGGADMAQARKIGVTDKEIDTLCAAVISALAAGSLDPAQLRSAVGGASRNLGDAGKKKGLTTTLPLALGRLQSEGEIRREPTNGRLDQQRYRYARWTPNPLAKYRLSRAEAYVDLARRYFRWIGPASPAQFQWFSGLGVKAAAAALDPLKLVPVDRDSDQLMFAEDLDALSRLKPPSKPAYALVSSLDGMTLLRRDLASLLETKDLMRQVRGERGNCDLGGLADLPSHAIFDRGRLVGLWEFDTESNALTWWLFEPADKRVQTAIAETETFVRDELGDARSFSLDSPKSRAPKIEALRKADQARALS